METIIVTRHKGLVRWLEKNGITGKVIQHALPEDIEGKEVIGVLPPHLACLAEAIITVDVPNLPLEKRGMDISPEEMDLYGAILKRYVVLGEPVSKFCRTYIERIVSVY